MDRSASRHPRLRASARGMVAWSYLLIGLLVLPMMVDLLLHGLGVVSDSILPIPAELGGWLLGMLIFLGWPFAIAVAWFFRRDRLLAFPAVLFLAAELVVVVWFQAAPASGFAEAIVALAGLAFGIAAIRAWVLWIQG